MHLPGQQAARWPERPGPLIGDGKRSVPCDDVNRAALPGPAAAALAGPDAQEHADPGPE